jgi:hypothetical protein
MRPAARIHRHNAAQQLSSLAARLKIVRRLCAHYACDPFWSVAMSSPKLEKALDLPLANPAFAMSPHICQLVAEMREECAS